MNENAKEHIRGGNSTARPGRGSRTTADTEMGVQSEMGRALLNKGTGPQFPASKEKERIQDSVCLSVCVPYYRLTQV